MLKGFKDFINLYTPRNILLSVLEWNNSTILSDIKTHAFNIVFHNPPHETCEIIATKEEREKYEDKLIEIEKKLNSKQNLNLMKDDSTTIFGRDENLNICYEEIQNVIKTKSSLFMVVKGIYGSGKSLFIRCLLKKILENNPETKNTKFRYIFNSYQLPNSLYDPLNGFKKILREIYYIMKNDLPCKI